MSALSSPLAAGVAATVGIGLLVFAAVVAAGRLRRRRQARAVLPKGADAALWSIVEAVPDPRNHLALTRDLSGEVRITEADRQAAAALAADRPRVARQPAPRPAAARSAGVASRPAAAHDTVPADAGGAVAVLELRTAEDLERERAGRAVDLEEAAAERRRHDTEQVFFAGEPRLTRF